MIDEELVLLKMLIHTVKLLFPNMSERDIHLFWIEIRNDEKILQEYIEA